jgi:hypothetical protein
MPRNRGIIAGRAGSWGLGSGGEQPIETLATAVQE